MIVRGALPHEMTLVKDHAEGWAQRSAGRWTVEAIMRDIAERDRQAWVIDRDGEILAVALTRLAPPVAFIDAASGRNRLLWQDDLDETVGVWARAQGAERVVSFMRPGWTRAAKRRGWRMAHVEMIRELT